MKNLFLKALVPFMSLTTFLVAAEGSEAFKPACPQYDHRMTVFHPAHIGYEYLPNDDLYLGVEVVGTEVYNVKTKGSAIPAFLEVRGGRSYFYNGQDHIRPFIGGMLGKDLKTRKVTQYAREFGQFVDLCEIECPLLAFGFVGCTVEREFNSRLSLGLTAKAMIGGPVQKSSKYQEYTYGLRDILYGADLSMPFTIRLGEARNWDIRLEPFAVVMNGNVRYLGHRSAIAYRF